MIRVNAGGHEFSTELFVFDKDGLLFKSSTFWKGLVTARLKAFESLAGPDLIPGWAKLLGANIESGSNGFYVEEVSATGCFALASPLEEMIATAGYLALQTGLSWNEAREASRDIFSLSDNLFDLESSLEPRKGFPGIFRRLREANVKYGIATSDTRERAIRSMDLFDDSSGLAFIVTPEDVKHGKPDAEMILQISETTGVPTCNITVIGDSFVDVLMAKNAGAVGIGIPESREMAEQIRRYTDIVLTDLDEILLL